MRPFIIKGADSSLSSLGLWAGVFPCFVSSAAALALAGLVVSSAMAAEPKSGKTSGVQITELPDRLQLHLEGELFTEYCFKDVSRPYCYPLIGPGGAAMTRNWPMKDVPDEEHDHPHHRSFWFSHGAANGVDFWSEAKQAGKTVHQGFLKIQPGKDTGLIVSSNHWVAPDGTIVATDTRTLRIYTAKPAEDRMFDFEITIFAPAGKDLVLGDTKEGTMAIRLAETMRLKGKVGRGRIVNSEGVRDAETWGKRAAWCDYYGPVNGKTVGVAIFDHPQNPRHPTWWHVRDYGLFAANPFGKHDFERLPDKSAGDLTIPAGSNTTFRYRVVLHSGDEQQARIAEKYQQYAK